MKSQNSKDHPPFNSNNMVDRAVTPKPVLEEKRGWEERMKILEEQVKELR